MLDAPDHAAMIDRITNAKFNTTRLKPGYDEKEVDNFLDQVIAQLRAGGVPEVREARFSLTRMRPGYVQQDVDDLLDEIDLYAETLRSALGRLAGADRSRNDIHGPHLPVRELAGRSVRQKRSFDPVFDVSST
jgi:DivIVA domain-containing protein